jgi:hypothetical protein
MRTVTHEEFIKHGIKVFDEYRSLKYVSFKEEQEYLRFFKRHVRQLDRLWGGQLFCGIIPDEDRVMFHNLKPRLRLYRGYRELEKRNGISWSLSRKVAEGFAHCENIFNPREDNNNLTPRVVTGWTYSGKVLAYSNDGEEQEVIIDPADVREINDIKLRAKPEFPVSAEPLEWLLSTRQHHGSEILK